MSTKPYETQLETALTQCQHIAYDALVKLENEMQAPAGSLTLKQLRTLTRDGIRALNRVNVIAERSEADPEFVAMLTEDREEERRAEEIIPGVTVGSTEDDLNGEFASLPPVFEEAGAMSTSDGLGAAAGVERRAVQACSNLLDYMRSGDREGLRNVVRVELEKAGYLI